MNPGCNPSEALCQSVSGASLPCDPIVCLPPSAPSKAGLTETLSVIDGLLRMTSARRRQLTLPLKHSILLGDTQTGGKHLSNAHRLCFVPSTSLLSHRVIVPRGPKVRQNKIAPALSAVSASAPSSSRYISPTDNRTTPDSHPGLGRTNARTSPIRTPIAPYSYLGTSISKL